MFLQNAHPGLLFCNFGAIVNLNFRTESWKPTNRLFLALPAMERDIKQSNNKREEALKQADYSITI